MNVRAVGTWVVPVIDLSSTGRALDSGHIEHVSQASIPDSEDLFLETIAIELPDPKDRVFYEVVTEERKEQDAYQVTGNIKHYCSESGRRSRAISF